VSRPRFRPYDEYREYPPQEMLRRARDLRAEMLRRRTIRQFSDRPVAREVIEECLRVAVSAPSGANRQPWRFVVVSEPETKRRLRRAAEREEADFYQRRAPNEWLEALAPLGTDQHKPFLETAPYLIVIFAEQHGVGPDGESIKNYYVAESVGIATGLLIGALHHAGLACLTHTPAPMRFLNELLGRPRNEKPYLILVTGYPVADAEVPEISKKRLAEQIDFV
jgi:iodotyrosine deiodinase